jgi:hypothetical protein
MSTEEAIIRLEGKIVALKDTFTSYCLQAEKMQIERAQALKDQLEKNEKTLNLRLETMNDFRAQINSERVTYVTNEKLDLRIKPLERMFWGLTTVVSLLSLFGIPLLIIFID